jgi:hypothetical protein
MLTAAGDLSPGSGLDDLMAEKPKKPEWPG